MVAGLYVPVLSNDSSQMKRIFFGYPFGFIEQDFSDQDVSFSFFPRYERVHLFDRTIERVDFLNFVIDFLIIFGIIEVIVFVLEKLKSFLVNWNFWPYSSQN